MKKTIKLTDVRQNELQKDEMQFLVGGEHVGGGVCSCSSSCPLNDETKSAENLKTEKAKIKAAMWQYEGSTILY